MSQECADCLEKIRLRVASVMDTFYREGLGKGMFELELLYCNLAARVVQQNMASDEEDSPQALPPSA